jgi:hypothetical protein
MNISHQHNQQKVKPNNPVTFASDLSLEHQAAMI